MNRPGRSGARATTSAAVVAILLCSALPFSARALEPSERERAEAAVADGAKMFDQGRFQDALSRYEAAYAIFPSPKIFYSMAFAYQRLGKNVPAFNSLERFLRDARDAEPKHLAEARAELGRLTRKVAFVAISCDTDHAEVFLDGAAIGSTPLSGRMTVDPGRHEILIRSGPLGSRTKTFGAIAGRAMDLRIDLRAERFGSAGAQDRAPKRALPSSGPSKAEALIREATDLRKAGKDARAYPLFQEAYEVETTPRTAAQLGLVEIQLGYWLEAERHLTEALASPRDPWTSGNRGDLEASLARVKAAIGEVFVTGTPAGATVLVNGKPSGSLPVALVRAGEGPVNVEVRAPGHAPIYRSLIVLGGRREAVPVALEKEETTPLSLNQTSALGARTTGSDPSTSLAHDYPTTRDGFPGLARPLGWTAAGLAAAVVAFGAYQHAVWRSKFREFESFVVPTSPGQPPSTSRGDCGAREPNRGKDGCATIYSAYTRARTFAIASYVAGGLLAAGAVTMFVIVPREGGAGSEMACGPSPSFSGGWCRLAF